MFSLLKLAFAALTALVAVSARVVTKLAFAAEDLVDVISVNTDANLSDELESRGLNRTDLNDQFEARLKNAVRSVDNNVK